ncbi:MAG: hypothetical protein ABI036_16610, partial [Fibrobacteria bacterium]
ARAFIQEEFKQSKPMSDSLYRYVLDKYPNTEYAKQAERNLGLKPTVQTQEDLAHKLFLEAETARFGGGDLFTAVIPAYRRVVTEFPDTREAAKAQFDIAVLYEENAHGEEKVAGSLDSAISAFQTLRERYAGTPFGVAAETKLAAAGLKPRPKNSAPAAPASNATPAIGPVAPGTPGTPSAPAVPFVPAAPAILPSKGSEGAPAVPPENKHEGNTRPVEVETATPPAPAAPPDTSGYQPEDKPKEEIDNGYENVDQY